MIEWLSQNIATIVICLVLLGIVVAIIVNMINNKKKGKTSCGCGCSNCALKGTCHSENKE